MFAAYGTKCRSGIGGPPGRAAGTLTAALPGPPAIEFFGPTTGTPVIVVGRTAYSTSRPIRMTRYVYRADRVRLAHEVATIPEKYRDGGG
jgi:DNA-binding GntR family transcriptional regulator